MCWNQFEIVGEEYFLWPMYYNLPVDLISKLINICNYFSLTIFCYNLMGLVEYFFETSDFSFYPDVSPVCKKVGC